MDREVDSPFVRVDLFVAPIVRPDKFVATVEVPRFLTPPKVIVWGVRTFLHHSFMSPCNQNHHAYVEVFAVAATREVKGSDDVEEEADSGSTD